MWAIDLGGDRVCVFLKRPGADWRPFPVEVREILTKRGKK